MRYNKTVKVFYRTVFILILLILSAALISCSDNSFDNIKIKATNKYDIAPGEYTLDYTIDNIDEASEKYDLDLNVYVIDYNDENIEVSNNRTFNVKADNIYYVKIVISGIVGGKYKSITKDVIINAVKLNPKLILKQYILDIEYNWTTIELERGQSVSIDSLPDIPDSYPSNAGYQYTIISKQWIYFDKSGKEQVLTDEYLTNIQKSITVYAKFTYSMTARTFTLKFDTDSGSKIDDITATYGESIRSTIPIPTKNGYFFCGYYKDKAYNDIYLWSETINASYTLYAKWEKYNSSNIDNSFFNYTLKNKDNSDTDRPFPYYEISVKENVTFPKNTVIPNGYNNAPICIINDFAFGNHTEIETIYIPDNVFSLGSSAFANCSSLKEITFEHGSTVTVFSSLLFKNCSLLTKINVPDSVTKIADDCFSGCGSITEIAFGEDSLLTDIVTPSTAFSKTAITQLKLPYKMKGLITVAVKNKFGQTVSLDYYPDKEEDEVDN